MRARTKGIQLLDSGERLVDKQYRGEQIFERLGHASQDEAEAWLRAKQSEIDARKADALRAGDAELFASAARKYLTELAAAADVRTLDTISGHVVLMNHGVGTVPLASVCNDTFTALKADHQAGRNPDGTPAVRVKATGPGPQAACRRRRSIARLRLTAPSSTARRGCGVRRRGGPGWARLR